MRQINLLPEAIQQAENKRFLIASLVLALVPLVMVLALAHALLQSRVNALRRIEQDPFSLSSSPEIVELNRQTTALASETGQFIRDHQVALTMISRQALAPQVLTLTANAAGDRIWLQSLDLDYAQKILVINGRSTETRQVSAYMLELEKLPYFQNVELVTMGKDVTKQREDIDFKIQCALR